MQARQALGKANVRYAPEIYGENYFSRKKGVEQAQSAGKSMQCAELFSFIVHNSTGWHGHLAASPESQT